jgi:hypothetical protein
VKLKLMNDFNLLLYRKYTGRNTCYDMLSEYSEYTIGSRKDGILTMEC